MAGVQGSDGPVEAKRPGEVGDVVDAADAECEVGVLVGTDVGEGR